MTGITKEERVQMAREAGFETHERKGHIRSGLDIITGEDGSPKFERLMNAILERAAVECDDQWSKQDEFDGKQAVDCCSNAIRALKTKE